MPMSSFMFLDFSSLDLSEITSVISGSSLSDVIPADRIREVLGQLDTTIHMGLAVVLLIFTLLGCFFGYKFARFFMSLTGLVAGLLIGYIVSARVLSIDGIPVVLATVAGGILLAAMSYWIYRAGIFVLCFVFSFAAAATVLPFTDDIQFFLCTVVGFAVGAISQRFIRPVIILTSAIVCGIAASGAFIRLADLTGLGIPTDYLFTLLLGAALSILGIIVQFATTKEPGAKPAQQHKDNAGKH